VPYGGGKQEFTEAQARILRNVAKNRIPAPPLLAMDEVADVHIGYKREMQNAQQQMQKRLDAWCMRLNRRLGAVDGAGDSVPVNVFPYIGQAMDDQFLADIEQAIMTAGCPVSRIEAEVEDHHPCMQTVRIGIHCPLPTTMVHVPIGVKGAGSSTGSDPKTVVPQKKVLPGSASSLVSKSDFTPTRYEGKRALALRQTAGKKE